MRLVPLVVLALFCLSSKAGGITSEQLAHNAARRTLLREQEAAHRQRNRYFDYDKSGYQNRQKTYH